MSFKLILFILIHLAALTYFIEMLRRVAKRVNEYNLKDTRQTLPFGFIRLLHVVILYVLIYVVWIIASVMLYLYFIDSTVFSLGGEPSRPSDVILDL